MKIYSNKFFLIISVITLMLFVGITAQAEGDFLMRIDTVTVPVGYEGEVVVPVYIDSMPDDMQLSCFAWEFYFDSDRLSFVRSTDAADFAGELVVTTDDCTIGKFDRVDGTLGKFRYGWTTTNNYITQTGEALRLPFYVSGDMEPGVYNIVADPFGDVRSGTVSYIYTDEILTNINAYLTFGAVIVEGDVTEYNDYEIVASRAKFYDYIPEEEHITSGTVDYVNGVPVNKEESSGSANTGTGSTSGNSSSSSSSSSSSTSGSLKPTKTEIATGNSKGTGVIISSDYDELRESMGADDVKNVADSFDAGTMVTLKESYIVFDTIKSKTGYLLCALYKGESLVGYDIIWAEAGEKASVIINYTEEPTSAVAVIMSDDGTFDCYGSYNIIKDIENN